MLQTLVPLTLVETPIVPLHSALALALVHPVVSLVSIAGLPLEDALPVLHIIPEVAIVLIAVRSTILFPLSWSIFQAIGEVSDIRCTISPAVGAKTMRLAIFILTLIRVAILVFVSAFAMLESVKKFALVAITIFPLVHTIAGDLAFLPLANV